MPHKDPIARKSYYKTYNATRRETGYNNSRSLKRKAGVTSAQRDLLLLEQGMQCDICGRTEPDGRGWAIDHDHAHCPGNKHCGKCIRGILCFPCNSGLGQFCDDPELLYRAIEYLIKSKDVLQDANPSYRRVPAA